MISIITAVHNQINVNQLFWESLQKYTKGEFELIIIDNASTDGSGDFFAAQGAQVIRNNANYSYPYCQNQGIRVAKYDWLVFMNNDLIVSPNWDAHILENMTFNGLEVATVCGIEQVESVPSTKKLKRRWNRIKTTLSIFSLSCWMLRFMHKLMYGNWEQFCNERYNNFRHQIKEGFVGNTVVMRRSALDKIGLWDERVQGADFDLYLRSLARARDFKDMKCVHICLDTFIHHYIRLTTRAHPPVFADQKNLISVEDKWGKNYQAYFNH